MVDHRSVVAGTERHPLPALPSDSLLSSCCPRRFEFRGEFDAHHNHAMRTIFEVDACGFESGMVSVERMMAISD